MSDSPKTFRFESSLGEKFTKSAQCIPIHERFEWIFRPKSAKNERFHRLAESLPKNQANECKQNVPIEQNVRQITQF